MDDRKRELGTISDVKYGVEPDHGIVTCSLGIDFKGSQQGFGNLCLDDDLLKDFLKELCATFGVKKPKDLKSKACYALRCFSSWNENIEGLESVDTKKRFIISKWRRKHFPNSDNPLQAKINRLQSDIVCAERRITDAERELKTIKDKYTSWE